MVSGFENRRILSVVSLISTSFKYPYSILLVEFFVGQLYTKTAGGFDMKYEVTSLNTKKLFAEALKNLVVQKSFSKITVSELIRVCNVNRKTFYYHFADVYDLLKWTLEQEAIEVVKKFDLIIDYEEVILFAMDYIEKNSVFLKNIYDSVGRDELKRFFLLGLY